VKYLAIAILTISLFLPSNSAFAAFTFGDSYANEIIENVQSADSVEFELDADILVKKHSDGERIFQIDTSASGSSTGINTADEMTAIDAAYNTQSEDSTVSKSGKAIRTMDRIYFTDDADGKWYFMELQDTSEYQQISSGVDSVLEDFTFDAFVITNILDNTTVDGTTMSRFEYTVDSEKFIDLVKKSGEFTDEDISEIKSYIENNVELTGEIWIDTEAMLPYKITAHGTVNDEENDIDIAVNVDLTFTSFNKRLNIQEPKDAIDVMAQYRDDDGDGLLNGREEFYGSDPTNPDTDGDGFNDGLEVRNGFNPISTGQLDSDNDSLGDHDEMVLWHTNRYRADSDYDGYNDAVEIRYLYNPNGTGALDADRDGVSDHDEMFVWHTNRFKSDTDGDGYSDATEIRYGYNPNGVGRI